MVVEERLVAKEITMPHEPHIESLDAKSTNALTIVIGLVYDLLEYSRHILPPQSHQWIKREKLKMELL